MGVGLRVWPVCGAGEVGWKPSGHSGGEGLATCWVKPVTTVITLLAQAPCSLPEPLRLRVNEHSQVRAIQMGVPAILRRRWAAVGS